MSKILPAVSLPPFESGLRPLEIRRRRRSTLVTVLWQFSGGGGGRRWAQTIRFPFTLFPVPALFVGSRISALFRLRSVIQCYAMLYDPHQSHNTLRQMINKAIICFPISGLPQPCKSRFPHPHFPPPVHFPSPFSQVPCSPSPPPPPPQFWDVTGESVSLLLHFR